MNYMGIDYHKQYSVLVQYISDTCHFVYSTTFDNIHLGLSNQGIDGV